jgi:hypothetical protein
MGKAKALREDLLAGRVEKLSPVARRSKSRPFGQLISTISHAARGGRVEEAEDTAFYAASYAYRNSLDYFLGLLSYLDGFHRARADSAAAQASATDATHPHQSSLRLSLTRPATCFSIFRTR